MDWKGARVVVTGHCGFVGANLVRRLLDLKASVNGMDVVLTSPSLRVLRAESPPVSIGTVEYLADTEMAVQGADVVFHLAGLGHIADCQQRPADAFRINAFGTVNVLEAVRRRAPNAIVVCASSNHVYLGGNPNATLVGSPRRVGGGYGLGESCPLQATDAYGASKAAADLAVKCYRESYGLRAAALRHVNCYGPADVHESHLVTGAILSCLKGERPKLKSDGTPLKAYLHVHDIVRAYMTVAEHVDELSSHAVNVTDPRCEAPAIAVARTVMDVAGMEGGPEILRQDLSQSGYEERLDPTLIRNLGWEAIYTLYTGIAETFWWYKDHGGMAWRDT